MAQLARVPAAPAPPGGTGPRRRRLPGWLCRPFSSLRQAWRSQVDLWDRWYVAPYQDAGPLRWRRREGKEVLDGSTLPQDRKERR